MIFIKFEENMGKGMHAKDYIQQFPVKRKFNLNGPENDSNLK